MAERSQYQYTPLQGPVWTEPVASRLSWLPQGQQPARGLPPNRLGDFARPEFAALYKPEGLQWLPSERYAGRLLLYSFKSWTVADTVPPGDPRHLDWRPDDRYVGRPLPRPSLDWTVLPVQFAAPAFNPQNLEWLPKGAAPQVPIELRRIGDFAQPPFASLYRPEGLQWLLQGLQPARSIPFVWQGAWVIDPSPVVTVAFDPQFFPFQATDITLARTLRAALQSDFTTPPLPPGPDVIPPPADTGLGGSSAVHPRRRVVYEKGDKRKPKTFIDRIGEPFVELEKTGEPVPDAASAGPPVNMEPVREALSARLPAPLPSVSTPLVTLKPAPDDEDDDLLLLS